MIFFWLVPALVVTIAAIPLLRRRNVFAVLERRDRAMASLAKMNPTFPAFKK